MTKVEAKGFFPSPFGQLYYWTIGTGPALTLIHQSAQSSDEYLGMAKLLSDSFQIIGLDLPGHGKSANPPQELEVNDLSDAVVAVLDHLGIQTTHLLGHHGGVILAVDIATRHSNRVDKVIASGGGIRREDEAKALKKMPMTRDLPVDPEGAFLSQTWAVYRKMSASSTPPALTLLPFLVGLQARLRPYDMHHALYRWDEKAAWASFDKPSLLIRGTEDLYSGDVEARHKSLPNSRYQEIEGGGAWLFYEQPKACADCVRAFLAG